MKKLNKILASIFITISVTEITYPIILTGPARRNAHKQQAEEEALIAYELGKEHAEKEHNQNQQNENYNSGNEENQQPVTIQSLDYNDFEQENPGIRFIDQDAEENYADDAVVQIQALGDGSLFANLSSEEKAKIKEKIESHSHDKENDTQRVSRFKEKLQARLKKIEDESKNQQEVTTQSMDESYDEDYVEIQAIEDNNQSNLQQNEKSATAQLEQAVHATSDFAQAVEHQEDPAPAPEPALMHVEQPAMTDKEVAQSAPASQPVEHVKIVKVYPVYDAMKAGFEMVKAAAFDMYNYAYSFITTYRSGHAEKAEVKVQQFPSK